MIHGCEKHNKKYVKGCEDCLSLYPFVTIVCKYCGKEGETRKTGYQSIPTSHEKCKKQGIKEAAQRWRQKRQYITKYVYKRCTKCNTKKRVGNFARKRDMICNTCKGASKLSIKNDIQQQQDIKKRICLSCGNSFTSMGIYNRRCSPCKNRQSSSYH